MESSENDESVLKNFWARSGEAAGDFQCLCGRPMEGGGCKDFRRITTQIMPAESHSTSDPGAILWIRVNVCPQVPLGYDETWKRWGL